MEFIKYIILLLILISSTIIGKLMGNKYKDRVIELEEIKNSFNIIKTKIKFTYEPIPEIFEEVSKTLNSNIKEIYKEALKNIGQDNELYSDNVDIAWKKAVDKSNTNLEEEDKRIIKMMSKLLGQTDVEGQVGQIEIAEKFLEGQIEDAIAKRNKNQRLYMRLGTITGLVISIILY